MGVKWLRSCRRAMQSSGLGCEYITYWVPSHSVPFLVVLLL